MEGVRQWALNHLEDLFPTGPDEPFKASHFSQWRKGDTAVDLILAGYLCDIPELLPYGYYVVATSDWSTEAQRKAIGLHRLSADSIIRLGAARSFLQEQFSAMLISKGSKGSAIGFPSRARGSFLCRGPPGCISSTAEWGQDEAQLKNWICRADPVLWIKAEWQGLNGGKWSFCLWCADDWRFQARNTRRKKTCIGPEHRSKYG